MRNSCKLMVFGQYIYLLNLQYWKFFNYIIAYNSLNTNGNEYEKSYLSSMIVKTLGLSAVKVYIFFVMKTFCEKKY